MQAGAARVGWAQLQVPWSGFGAGAEQLRVVGRALFRQLCFLLEGLAKNSFLLDPAGCGAHGRAAIVCPVRRNWRVFEFRRTEPSAGSGTPLPIRQLRL